MGGGGGGGGVGNDIVMCQHCFDVLEMGRGLTSATTHTSTEGWFKAPHMGEEMCTVKFLSIGTLHVAFSVLCIQLQ